MERTLKGKVRRIKQNGQGLGVYLEEYGVLTLQGTHFRNKAFTVSVEAVLEKRPEVFAGLLRPKASYQGKFPKAP